MANEVLFSFLNPVQFTKLSPTDLPQYRSRMFDYWRFVDTIKDFQQPTQYRQPWQLSDSCRLQLISNYGPASIALMNCEGVQVGTSYSFDTKQEDFFRPGYFIREIEIDIADFTEGYYYWQLSIGSSDVWISEPQHFLTTHPNTMYHEYKHYERLGDTIFETGFSPAIRVHAGLKYNAPKSKTTAYVDQSYNQTTVKSIPHRSYTMIYGGVEGLPPWVIDRLNWVLSCSDCQIDGRFYSKADGAEFEENEIDDYPMAGYTIELVEKLNKSSIAYEDATAIIGMNAMVAVVDTKGFGIDDSGGDFLEIENVE